MKYFFPFLVLLLTSCGVSEQPSGSLPSKSQLLPKSYLPTASKKIAHPFPDRLSGVEPTLEWPIEEPYPEPEEFVFVETSPEFPGGSYALNKYLEQNIRYPEIAREMGIEGKAYVEFTVVEDGTIQDIKVLRSIDQSMDREALRVLRMMPKWIPAQSQGKRVKRTMILPIVFRIE